MNLEPYTFGNSDAATVLAKELNARNSPKLTNRVCKYVNEFAHVLNQLEKTDYKTKTLLASMLRERVMESVTDRWEWDGNIRTVLKNVLHTLYMKHTCWEIQRAGKGEKNFGVCQKCSSPALVRYKVHNKVRGRYCATHQHHIDGLHQEMRASRTK